MNSDPQPYLHRGLAVPAKSAEQIMRVAEIVSALLKLKPSTFRKGKSEKFLQTLEQYGINVDTVADSEWPQLAKASVNTQTLVIYMPASRYADYCKGDRESIRILLHELGHIFLCHEAKLHFAASPSRKEEDSEWQADYFADHIAEKLNLYGKGPQLEFRF